METYIYKKLSSEQIQKLCQRNLLDDTNINNVVLEIIENVKANGDKALIEYAEKFDGAELQKLFVDKNEIQVLASKVNEEQKLAIRIAFENISKFHRAQIYREEKVETTKGVHCWRENRAIENVGLYIPGGSAVLPSTFLMLAIPAKIAGCKNIVVCSPPQKNGNINEYIAYCAMLLNIEKIFLAGGAQAIAAMAFGTDTIPKVEKIFGPGNRFVTNAKNILQLQGAVAIDMPAGPSEVLVIGETDSRADFIASDLLSQAEHGTDSQVVLVSTCADLIYNVQVEIEKQIQKLPRKKIAEQSLEKSFFLFVSSLEEAVKFSNIYAPEHLILSIENPGKLVPLINNAGSVFLGKFTPEAAGDYASGTNHTLPTSGYAKMYSGISVDSFLKKISFQEISEEGILNLGKTVETLAEMEGLLAHKNAVSIRLKSLQ